MTGKAKGKLIIIGGHEDKIGDQVILEEVCKDAITKKGSLVIVTIATSKPKEMAKQYTEIFKKLGVRDIEVIDIRERQEAEDPKNVKRLEKAAVLFFTGGDQLRITSQIGDSPVYQHMMTMLKNGLTIAGTSAGAAVMPETMIINGPSDESNKISALDMAPGLGLIEGVVIDSHFAERGRMGRLLGAVTRNPRNLGLGIDEDTAVLFQDEERFSVIGSGAVYVVDGAGISYSSLSEQNAEGVVSIFGTRLHVLGTGDQFDMQQRIPIRDEKSQLEETKSLPASNKSNSKNGATKNHTGKRAQTKKAEKQATDED